MTDSRGVAFAAAVFLVAVLARALVVGTVHVRTSSMAPAVQPGEVLLFDRLSVPRVGDVVVARVDGRTHVKRLVARGPGVAELFDGRLYVDGVAVGTGARGEETWIDGACEPRTVVTVVEESDGRRWQVIPGGRHDREKFDASELWLLGDNRGSSSDSRHWGAVPTDEILGVVRAIVWSRTSCGAMSWNRLGSMR